MTGQTISHYRIVEKLGEGGMGVVYKAEDTKLERTVALKFLLPHLVSDEPTRQRFLREAQAAAALSHSNICTVYEIDDPGGQTFIAMEFVDGPSVAEKVKERPLPVEEALDIATQTAEGLHAAHEKGVVHRDVKGANILLTQSGQVKITDFGLAHLAERSRLTKSGTSMGTPAFMSPEQAQNLPTNHRTDIWSLGVMLYEMLTGRLPFEGQYEQAILYSIINEDPEPATALRTGLPVEVDRVIAKALAKKPDERYQHMDDLRVDLRALRRAPSGKSKPAVEPRDEPFARKRAMWKLAGVFALGLAIGAAGLWVAGPSGTTPQLPHRRFSVTPGGVITDAVISPDGRYIAYVDEQRAPPRLHFIRLSGGAPRDGAPLLLPSRPSWSPDGEWIAYAPTLIRLVKLSLFSGSPIEVSRLPVGVGASSWSPDGAIIVVTAGVPTRLYEVPAEGGRSDPRVLIEPEPSESEFWFLDPQFLPAKSGRRALAFAMGQPGQYSVAVQDLSNGRRLNIASGVQPRYSPTGHLVYQSENESRLWAIPFSVDDLEVTGSPFQIQENAARPSIAADGTLVYVEPGAEGLQQLIWRDRSGKKLGTIGQPQPVVAMPVLSPDGKRVVTRSMENGAADIWIHEVASPAKSRITFHPGEEDRPTWYPTGDKVTFSSLGAGNLDVYIKSADGTGNQESLSPREGNEFGYAWTRDGKYLVASAGGDISYLRRKEDGSYEWVPFVVTEFDELSPDISPDDTLVAYESNESGRYEVYVQPFPDGGWKRQVSNNGGVHPRWRGDGKELYYVEGDTLMAVAIERTPTFTVGSRTRLFSDETAFVGRGTRYDVAPDGQRFVVVETLKPPGAGRIHVVQNWYEPFRNRAGVN